MVECHLVTLAVFTDAKENPTIDRPVDLGLQLQDEITVDLISNEEASLPGRILISSDGIVDHFPFPADVVGGKSHVLFPPV